MEGLSLLTCMTALTVRSGPKGRLRTLRRVRSFVDEATTPILCHEQSSKDKESTAFPEIDISITTKCGCHTSSCRNFCLPAAQQATYNDCLSFRMFLYVLLLLPVPHDRMVHYRAVKTAHSKQAVFSPQIQNPFM